MLSLLAPVCAADRPHDKDSVVGWDEQIERTRGPLLVFGRTHDVHLHAPLTVIGIGVVHLERYAGASAVTLHRTIEGHLHCSPLVPTGGLPTPRTSRESPAH